MNHKFIITEKINSSLEMTTEYDDSVSRNQSDGSYQAINLIRRNLLLKEIAGLTEISGIIVAKVIRNRYRIFRSHNFAD